MNKPIFESIVLGCLAVSSAAVAEETGPSLGLGAYKMVEGAPTQVPDVTKNASGLTFNPNTGTLLCIRDHPAAIVEFTPVGEAKRTIEMEGFYDVEGIVHMEDDTVAVIQEGRGDISVFNITPETREIRKADTTTIVVDRVGSNLGLEGLTYDPATKVFFIVKEKEPRKVYKVTLDGEVSHPWDAEKNTMELSDLSGIHFDPATGHLYVLSHESQAVVECSTDGKVVSRLHVEMGKAEGITVTADGALYICGEPDSLLIFSK